MIKEKELDKPISESTFADMWRLFEHDRCPTKRELDRVIRSLGYRPLAWFKEMAEGMKVVGSDLPDHWGGDSELSGLESVAFEEGKQAQLQSCQSYLLEKMKE